MLAEHSPELESILANLTGFGLEDTEDYISITSNGHKVSLKLSNYCTDAELAALEAVADKDGYAWVQALKAEILARSISCLDSNPISDNMVVTHPTRFDKTGVPMVMPVRTVLRDVLQSWGQETMNILWKALMVHRQKIEDRIVKEFPETQLFTAVEQRLIDRWVTEMDEINKDIFNDIVKKEGVDLGGDETPASEAEATESES